MKITIELDSFREIKQIITILKEIGIESFNVIGNKEIEDKEVDSVTKGDKDIDPSELFGIWKSDPKSLGSIRKEGWERNWS